MRPSAELLALVHGDISKITLSFTTLLPFWLYGTYL
jgi:hypothetical protein